MRQTFFVKSDIKLLLEHEQKPYIVFNVFHEGSYIYTSIPSC